MRQLVVENFSCIKEANLAFGRLTVIVGPQASGKSVLSKLAYFFLDAVVGQWSSITNGESVKSFEDEIKGKFKSWFPISAWGAHKFSISFSAGNLKIVVARKIYAGNVQDDIRVKFSPEFVEQYERVLAQAQALKAKTPNRDEIGWGWERDYEVRRLSVSSTSKLMGQDAANGQVFVPAGRSFFTNVGKAVTAFDQSGLLDPLTVKFGRLFAASRERTYYEPSAKLGAELVRNLEVILGGKFVNNKGAEYVEATDGRKVPLSSLSSGQQELLPLLSVLPNLVGRDYRQLAYIEEPEAHLFPQAQSKIIEVFAQIINESSKTDLVITTHSPYVLVKINNLLKAGQIGRMHGDRAKRVLEVIPKSSWLMARQVRAYAIIEGVLMPIMDSQGFVDGSYLDDVSGLLEQEFNELLSVQHED